MTDHLRTLNDELDRADRSDAEKEVILKELAELMVRNRVEILRAVEERTTE